MLQTDSIAIADSLSAKAAADSLAFIARVDSFKSAFKYEFPKISSSENQEVNNLYNPELPVNSLQVKSQQKKVQYANDLFKTHQLQMVNTYPRTNFKPTPDWFTFILLLIVIAITLLRTFNSKVFNQLMRAFYNNTVANQIIRDENILVQRASVTLSISSYFVLALLLFKIADFYNYSNPLAGEGIVRFLFIALFVSLAYSVKMILLKIAGYVLKIDKPVAAYIFTIFLSNNVIGVILIPFLIIISYAQLPFIGYFYYGCIAIALTGLFYRWVKGIVISLSIPNLSLVYIIFYLCGLEIAPLLVIAKLITL